MLDGTQTTFDWQASPTDIAVVAVGSFEQHGAHLPLLTDDILAEYFGRIVAEELNAALLPTVNFGTCMEHSAFRGSVTLRPETLMAIVRDLADSLERQGFRFLVFVNYHGGNFSLLPPARDINSQNRPLKVLVVNCGEFRGADCAVKGLSESREYHAGVWDTSVMLAIRPDLVGPDRRDAPANPPNLLSLERRDLTMFGTGHIVPAGVIGTPSQANAELGHIVIRSIRTNLSRYLHDRIGRLRKSPIY